jgi:hypothetical protein
MKDDEWPGLAIGQAAGSQEGTTSKPGDED